MKFNCLRNVALGIFVGLCGSGLFATDLETVPPPVIHRSSATSAEVRALENATLVDLKRVYFTSGATKVMADDRAVLDDLVGRLIRVSDSVIELRGYADGAATPEQNLALSTERANSIARFLSVRGVPSRRILIVGLGELDPNDSAPDPRHQRVDVRVFAPPSITDIRQTKQTR